jgi:hypothetical protein
VLGPVEDSSCMSYLLLLPIGTMDEPDAIIARLVQERGGDALISLTVELRNSTFALPIVSSTCTIVKGIAVKNVR